MDVASFVAMFMAIFAALSSDEIRQQRAARDRDLARYKHHPDANLLKLTD